MKKSVFRHEEGFGKRWLGRLFLLVMTTSFLGCVAAIPAAVVYYEHHDHFIVTVQVPENADKVYKTALEVTGEMSTEGKVKVLEKDDKERQIKTEIIDQPARKGSLKVTPIDAKSCQIVSIGEKGKYEKIDEAAALEVVNRITKKLGVGYTVIKG